MKLLECDDDLRDVKSDLNLRETLRFVEVREKLAALHEVKHQVKLRGCLEGVVERREERAVDDPLEDLALRSCVLRRLVLLRDFLLFEDFHGVEGAFIDSVDFLHEINPSVSAGAQQLEELEVHGRDFLTRIENN